MKINYGSSLSPPNPLKMIQQKEKYQKRVLFVFSKEGIAHSGPCRDQTRTLGGVSTALTNWANQLPIPARAPKKGHFLIDKTMVCAKEEREKSGLE